MLRLEGYRGPDRHERRNGPARGRSRASPTPSSSTCGCRWSTASAFCAGFAPTTTSATTPVAIVTGDYFLDDEVSTELRELGAELQVQAAVARGSGRARPQPAQGDPLTDSGSPIPPSLPPAAGRRHAGLVHAPGRPLHERVPRAARALFAARSLPDARSRDRGHAAAGPPHRGRRGDPLLRSAAAARADGHPVRLHPAARGRRSRTRCAARRTSTACGRFEPRESLAHVLDAIRQIKRELAGRVPLIGFAGAPFTLASYAIEGGHSSNFAHTKALMYGAPAAWHRFCDAARRRRRRLPASRRSRPASTPCRSSTRGSAR